MADKFKFKLNAAGVKELLKSQEMEEIVGSYASDVAGRAGAGYETDTKTMGTRVIASVYTTDPECVRDNYENNTLWKVVRG